MALTSQELGGRIAAARRDAGMTQDDLAKLLGVDRSAMAKIEKGIRKVDSLELLAISEATGSAVEDFLELEQPLPVLLRSKGKEANPRTRAELKWAEKFMADYSFLKEISPND